MLQILCILSVITAATVALNEIVDFCFYIVLKLSA